MSITTLDGVIAGLKPPQGLFKVGTAPEIAGVYHSHFYASGRPGAAAVPSPGVNGAALTSYAGQIPFTNPVSGNTHIARFEASASVACTLLLCDRLWHNSGLSVTSTSLQSITSPTWPARDANGSTNGEGVLIGLEVSTVTGAGTPVITLTYTDQDGNTGITTGITGKTASNIGTFEIFPLAAGDTGVRAVTGYQQNVTWTSGSIHLVAFRILGILNLPVANVGAAIDALTGGFPQLYNDTVPFLVQLATTTTATNIAGRLIYAQG